MVVRCARAGGEDVSVEGASCNDQGSEGGVGVGANGGRWGAIGACEKVAEVIGVRVVVVDEGKTRAHFGKVWKL